MATALDINAAEQSKSFGNVKESQQTGNFNFQAGLWPEVNSRVSTYARKYDQYTEDSNVCER